jgi:hypothetical protein
MNDTIIKSSDQSVILLMVTSFKKNRVINEVIRFKYPFRVWNLRCQGDVFWPVFWRRQLCPVRKKTSSYCFH